MAPLPPPSNVRLVSIVAQVDNGKTTLADSLVESNGIISERLAGTIRYMDFLEEEQRRGITMRASAIGLKHVYNIPKKGQQNKGKGNNINNNKKEMVIHLVDSPGHIDFSSEVTSSLLLCDGAIIVIDVVEGINARTHSIFREVYRNGLVPILCVNKIDRLCLDLGLTPTEAYVRIRELMESVNAAAAAMIISKEITENDMYSNNPSKRNPKSEGDNKVDDTDNVWNFDPKKGNVVFSSAYYGWGFSIMPLARALFREKIIPNIKPPMLASVLFGDCKYNKDTKKVVKWKQNSSDDSMPMFAEYALKPIWDIYENMAIIEANNFNPTSKGNNKINSNNDGMSQILSLLNDGCTASSQDMKITNSSQLDTLVKHFSSIEEITRAILRRFRPLSESVLDAISEIVPSPSEASSKIRQNILTLKEPSDGDISEEFNTVNKAVRICDHSEKAPIVAHVCKFLVTEKSFISDHSNFIQPDSENSDQSIIMGLTRVLSGTLTDTSDYFIYGPKYVPGSKKQKRSIRIYLLMGSSFVRVKSVPAGHVCAVYGIDDLQFKTLTMSDKENAMPLVGFEANLLQPLVKVNIEPVVASDTNALERGLIKLSLADASVEVTATSRGERLLACLGEIHLENSINDLEKVYCQRNADGTPIKLRISDPIVEFGESTVWFENESDYQTFFDKSEKAPKERQTTIPPYCDEEGLANAIRGRSRSLLSGRGAAIHIRVVPLAKSVFESIRADKVVEGSEDDLIQIGKALQYSLGTSQSSSPLDILSSLTSKISFMDEKNGNILIEGVGVLNGDNVKAAIVNLQSSGELYSPSSSENKDVTVDDEEIEEKKQEDLDLEHKMNAYNSMKHYIRNGSSNVDEASNGMFDSQLADKCAMKVWKSDMKGSVVAGFKLGMRAGPLCEEPVYGVLVVLEGVEIAMVRSKSTQEDLKKYESAKSITGGMVVSALRSGIRCALLTRPARLMEKLLSVTLHSSLAGLGPLHAILSRRCGRVVTDTMVDGTDLILISAILPQAESHKLSSELLKKSSGEVTAPELTFSHWDVLEEDPFWIPTSLEEREDYGEILVNGDTSTGLTNNALKYIRLTRKRKGLIVDSNKIVVAAEKQRTLARKK